jgi:hypothetical protein
MNTISENAGAWRPSIELAAKADRPEEKVKPEAAGKDENFKLFGDDGFTFFDFLDIINPLHHIPVVGTIYRQLTSDTIDPASRVLGSTLFFGPVGTVASIGDVLIRDATGRDVGEHMIAFLDEKFGDKAIAAKAAPVVTADAGAMTAVVAPIESVDPVTAWAMGETAYRNAIAAKAQTSRAVPVDVVASAAAMTPAAFVADNDEVRKWAAQTVTTAPAVNVSDGKTWAALTTPIPAPNAQPATATAATVRRDRNAAIRDATATIRHTKKSAALVAATSYGRLEQPDGPRMTPADKPAPFGAVAADGGWFTEAMLSAHERYRIGAGQPGQAPAHTVDLMH